MSFLSFIQSKQNALMIELYVFTNKYTSQSYWYTSYDKSLTIGTHTYEVIIAKHSNVINSTRVSQNNVAITVSKKSDIIKLMDVDHRVTWNAEIQLVNLGDTDIATIFKGNVVSVEDDKKQKVINCEPLIVNTRYIGLGMSYQEICPYVLYSKLCNANKNIFNSTLVIQDITGSVITFETNIADASPFYVGGYVRIFAANYITKQILSQTINSVTVKDVSLSQELVGQTATLYAGCDKLLDTCRVKFDNLPNFGGYRNIPFFNYFKGTPIG